MRCSKCSFWGAAFSLLAGLTLTFCSEPVGQVDELPSIEQGVTDTTPEETIVQDTLKLPKVEPLKKRSLFFDHIAFKKVKEGANSGVMNKYSHWDLPKDSGIYYRYMMFNTPRSIPETQRFHRCQMVVYKLTGNPGFYSDTNEVLIEMYCAFPDPDLGKLDIVGKHLDEIKSDFHAPAYSNNGLYAYDLGDGYTLFVKGDPITEFKLIRLKDKMSKQAFDDVFDKD